MNFLAVYTHETLSLLRRVKFPLSVLANRGHRFSFMAVSDAQMGLSFGADVTILPNWVFSPEEVALLRNLVQEHLFVYDLSDPSLLEEEDARETLRACHLVTVPNAYLLKQVKNLGVSCAITPSVLDVEYFMSANRLPKPMQPTIGCFGNWDWHLVREALIQVKGKHPRVKVLADYAAYKVLGPELSSHVEVNTQTYPVLLHSCLFGLIPIERDHGEDPIWSNEYGILSKPHVTLDPGEQNTELWASAIETMLTDSTNRARLGQTCYEVANPYRNTQQAGEYLQIYRKKLPHLVRG